MPRGPIPHTDAASTRRAWCPVVVMGISGSGKSVVSEALSVALAWPQRDGDAFHPAANIEKMRRGEPLDDADRAGWLDQIGGWLVAQPGPALVSCSALKRRYRDRLRAIVPALLFVHLHGRPDLIRGRLGGRDGHFMPASLFESQLATLEPLQPDEPGIVLDPAKPVEAIVAECVAALPDLTRRALGVAP